jgi:hypothetical protein
MTAQELVGNRYGDGGAERSRKEVGAFGHNARRLVDGDQCLRRSANTNLVPGAGFEPDEPTIRALLSLVVI